MQQPLRPTAPHSTVSISQHPQQVVPENWRYEQCDGIATQSWSQTKACNVAAAASGPRGYSRYLRTAPFLISTVRSLHHQFGAGSLVLCLGPGQNFTLASQFASRDQHGGPRSSHHSIMCLLVVQTVEHQSGDHVLI
jgi:hypothetical protein